MKNLICFKILKVKSLKKLVITTGNVKVSWRCQFNRKNQIRKWSYKLSVL